MPTLTHNRVALMQNRYHDHLIKTKRGKIANLSTHIHDHWFGTDANLNTHIHDHWFGTDANLSTHIHDHWFGTDANLNTHIHDHWFGTDANLNTHIHDHWFGTDANLNTHIHDHWFDTDTSKTHSVIGAILTLVLTHHFSYLGVCRRLCYQASCCFGIVLYSDCPMFE